MVEYTHDFDFKFGENGIFELKGECEFNVDEESSFKTNASLTNITVDQLRAITDLFQSARSIFKKFGEINKLKITIK